MSLNKYHKAKKNTYAIDLMVGGKCVLDKAPFESHYVLGAKPSELYLVLLPVGSADLHQRIVIPYVEGSGFASFSQEVGHEIADLFTSGSSISKSKFPKLQTSVTIQVWKDAINPIFACQTLIVYRIYVGTDGEEDSRVCAGDIEKKIYVSLGDHLFLENVDVKQS